METVSRDSRNGDDRTPSIPLAAIKFANRPGYATGISIGLSAKIHASDLL